MRHKDIIYLISSSTIQDELGNQIQQEIERFVYANQMAVSHNEFYAAASTGLKPERRFEIYSFEYKKEEKLRYEDKIYRILRVEEKGEKTRLICGQVIADA